LSAEKTDRLNSLRTKFLIFLIPSAARIPFDLNSMKEGFLAKWVAQNAGFYFSARRSVHLVFDFFEVLSKVKG
jgi:hypothetical protein